MHVFEVPPKAGGSTSVDPYKHAHKIGETIVPLSEIGNIKWYRLVTREGKKKISTVGQAMIRLNIVDASLKTRLDTFNYAQLCKVFPPNNQIYRHLYIDFSLSMTASTYFGGLPGPTKGELILDKYDFVKLNVGNTANIFGDILSTVCIGQLLLTDLRIIFLPYHISINRNSKGSGNNEIELLLNLPPPFKTKTGKFSIIYNRILLKGKY